MATTYQTPKTEANPLVRKYANVLIDRWFKRTFGWAGGRRLMQLLLQEMIPERVITDLHFGPQEHVNPIRLGKDIRLDVHCTDQDGKHFVVEVQRDDQSTFYERAVFNSSFVIQSQLPVGRTDWAFSPIYFIGIMNFSFHKGSDEVLFRYNLKERTSGEPMTDRIEYLFLEIPNCTKALTPEATQLDKICYVFSHISEWDERPEGFEGEFFDLLFKSLEIAIFAEGEKSEYLKDMTTERDLANQMKTAEDKGRADGVSKTALAMLKDGMPAETVSKYTGLSVEELSKL